MSSPFESYDDLEDADERLRAADPAERRVAIMGYAAHHLNADLLLVRNGPCGV
ncbi:hypothetical protein [Bradyrhizobium genosp. A]|uniref:hypothetical protein n=1 Tax=Bradyrhizobium genosp. A TaxID=83626 RepID=UPI003CF76A2E